MIVSCLKYSKDINNTKTNGVKWNLKKWENYSERRKNEIQGRWVRPPCRMGDENAVKDTFEWKSWKEKVLRNFLKCHYQSNIDKIKAWDLVIDKRAQLKVLRNHVKCHYNNHCVCFIIFMITHLEDKLTTVFVYGKVNFVFIFFIT